MFLLAVLAPLNINWYLVQSLRLKWWLNVLMQRVLLTSLTDTYSDEFGRLDFDRSQLGSGMSNRSKVKKFVVALNQIAERTHKTLFELQDLRQLAKDLQVQVKRVFFFFTLCGTSSLNKWMYSLLMEYFSGCWFWRLYQRTQRTRLPAKKRTPNIPAANHLNENFFQNFLILFLSIPFPCRDLVSYIFINNYRNT